MVDTGANTSLIKACKLNSNTYFNSRDKLILQGLSVNTPVETVGTCLIPVQVGDSTIDIKFHILNQATNVPFDGLLGKDFLQKESAIISYQSRTLSLKSSTIPINLNHQKFENQNINLIKLKARTETLIEIEIQNPENQEGIVPELELQKGVYLSKAITKVNENNRAYATILNTRIIDLQIKPISVCLERLPHSSAILVANNSNSPILKRQQVLENNMRLEHLNSEERRSILNICKEYHDIFHLSDDILTVTNAMEHEINLTNPTPIYTKSYRYPEIHKHGVNNQIDKMLKQGIIQPSISSWSSPLWIVPKKSDSSGERKWRVVIDYNSDARI